MSTTELDLETETRRPRGRKDASGQEAVIKLEALSVKVDELVRLNKAADEAATDFAEAIKAAAEAAGLNASTVRKYIVARAGDKFEEKKRDVQQLALVFDELPA